jgi:hypothetical protein
MAKSRPWRVRDSAGKAHTFSTKAKATAYKQSNPGSKITARPVKLSRKNNTAKMVAKVAQEEIKVYTGKRPKLRDLINSKEFKKDYNKFRKATGQGRNPKRIVGGSRNIDYGEEVDIDWELFREWYDEFYGLG